MNITEIYAAFAALRNAFLYSMQQTYTDIDRSHVEHALYGSIKFSDAYTLYRLLDKTRPKRMLEVGSFLGFSTRWLCEVCTAWGATVTAIDPNIKHRIFHYPREILQEFNQRCIADKSLAVVTAFFGQPFTDQDIAWRYTNELARDEAFVDKLVTGIPVIDASHDAVFDFVFIDGAHHYHAVAENFRIARQLLAPGGVITFHDALTWNDVNTFLVELQAQEQFGHTRIIDARQVFQHPALHQEPMRVVDGIGCFTPHCHPAPPAIALDPRGAMRN